MGLILKDTLFIALDKAVCQMWLQISKLGLGDKSILSINSNV